jgi:hypothetical protein
MSDNDVGQFREPTPAPSTEEYNSPGKVGREAFHGYRQLPKETEEKVYTGDEGLREAARDLASERGTERSEPVEEVPETPDDGGKYALSVKDAAKQLSAEHRTADHAAAIEQLTSAQGEVDVARYLLAAVQAGQISPETARAIENEVNAEMASGQQQPQQPRQPQQESPQPESVEQPAPSGLSPKVQAALADPEIRSALEQAIAPAEQARQQYANATAELASAATAAVLAQFPELREYSIHQLPGVLDYMSKTDPARHAAILGSLNHAGAIQAAAKEAAAQQAQMRNAQLSQWAAHENAAFEKMIESEATPQRREAVKSEFQNFARENNLTIPQIATIFAQNPVLQSAAFSRLVWDALSHRAAKRSAMSNPASRNAVPTVQRPGTARTRSEIAESELGDLKSEFKKAKGNEQLRLAVKLHQAQRRARG